MRKKKSRKIKDQQEKQSKTNTNLVENEKALKTPTLPNSWQTILTHISHIHKPMEITFNTIKSKIPYFSNLPNTPINKVLESLNITTSNLTNTITTANTQTSNDALLKNMADLDNSVYEWLRVTLPTAKLTAEIVDAYNQGHFTKTLTIETLDFLFFVGSCFFRQAKHSAQTLESRQIWEQWEHALLGSSFVLNIYKHKLYQDRITAAGNSQLTQEVKPLTDIQMNHEERLTQLESDIESLKPANNSDDLFDSWYKP